MPEDLTARPTAASLPYTAAVSISRYPASSAADTDRSVSASDNSPTPRPITGIVLSSLRETVVFSAAPGAELMGPIL
jgi:hypothetical protein